MLIRTYPHPTQQGAFYDNGTFTFMRDRERTIDIQYKSYYEIKVTEQYYNTRQCPCAIVLIPSAQMYILSSKADRPIFFVESE